MLVSKPCLIQQAQSVALRSDSDGAQMGFSWPEAQIHAEIMCPLPTPNIALKGKSKCNLAFLQGTPLTQLKLCKSSHFSERWIEKWQYVACPQGISTNRSLWLLEPLAELTKRVWNSKLLLAISQIGKCKTLIVFVHFDFPGAYLIPTKSESDRS